MQSDNGPPFQSAAFIEFWKDKGIDIRKAIPLSPQSNGAIERQNQGITKALAASRLDGRNWRHALQEYVHRHNTLVPHSRLSVTPFELMVGWKHRGTFPSLWGSPSNKKLDRDEIRERDTESKFSSKTYADSVRGAKESDIKIGDVVLLACPKRTKTDATYSSERFRVVAREGAKVVVISRTGVQYARNVQEVKKDPVLETAAELADEELDNQIDEGGFPALENVAGAPEDGESILIQQANEPRSLRSRKSMKRPSRFNDNFVYRVFH
ncbi:uncharacterized protein LOC131679758 [Topomyia yanbarensis]|uniref:uncharacterized protein LOC131679758 n=1 Tax=Topomyia yanbarensis TaxID=2498891 RepID=UPI00273C8809|nr:uncharacterized protein LOC131679758 [Topomyia yanbarensis]